MKTKFVTIFMSAILVTFSMIARASELDFLGSDPVSHAREITKWTGGLFTESDIGRSVQISPSDLYCMDDSLVSYGSVTFDQPLSHTQLKCEDISGALGNGSFTLKILEVGGNEWSLESQKHAQGFFAKKGTCDYKYLNQQELLLEMDINGHAIKIRAENNISTETQNKRCTYSTAM